jgi:serine/threonine-protein kinase
MTTDESLNRKMGEPATDEFRRGQIVGAKYKVINMLGRGGMGVVYHVHQIFMGRDYALKTLDKCNISDLSMRRFQLEAKAASLLDHPNLVQVHDFGLLDDGQPFLIMDWVDGTTIADRLKRSGPFTVDDAARIFAQVCLGLNYAHDQGVVHRDIKPSNIMLVNDTKLGDEGSIKVLDFGIAKLMMEDSMQALTKTGEIFGSPFYMSPEQCSGSKLDHRSDIYSLGCVLFEALTGAPPHMGANPLTTMMLHQSQVALPLKEASLGKQFPAALEQIVSKMLQKSPDDRYQNLGLVAHDLSAVFKGQPVARSSASLRVPEQPKTAKTVSIKVSTLWAIIIGIALVFGTVGTVAGYQFVLWQLQAAMAPAQNNSDSKNPAGLSQPATNNDNGAHSEQEK